MSRPAIDASRLTPELLVRAYAAGVFPMAKSANDPTIYWINPKTRGILPLDAVHVPRRLKRTVRAGFFEVVCDRDFDDVVRLCAEGTARRRDTWINPEIRRAYGELHALGLAHSVECWQEGALVGGLYGVALKGVFFGESMFSRARDASKVALIHLAARLKAGRFSLLDTQFVTEHLMQFGAVEIPARRYLERLEAALEVDAAFYPGEGAVSASLAELLQSSTHTS